LIFKDGISNQETKNTPGYPGGHLASSAICGRQTADSNDGAVAGPVIARAEAVFDGGDTGTADNALHRAATSPAPWFVTDTGAPTASITANATGATGWHAGQRRVHTTSLAGSIHSNIRGSNQRSNRPTSCWKITRFRQKSMLEGLGLGLCA